MQGQFIRTIVTIFCFVILSSSALASTEAIYQEDGTHYFKTLVQRGDGLGKIVRRIGVTPNWQSTRWIDAIKVANPNMIGDTNNFILNPGDTLRIPLSALEGLNGYTNAAAQFEVPTPTEPIIAEPTTPSYTPTTETLPPPTTTPGPDTTLSSDTEPSYADIDIHLGPGAYALNAKSSTNFETDLVTEAAAYASLRLGFNLSHTQRMTIHASPYYATYNPPPSVAFTQQSDFLFEGGVTYGFRVASATYINAVWTSQTRHFAKFNFTNLELITPLIHGAGLQLTGELFSFANSGVWYTITPKFLLPQTDVLEIDSGFQSQVGLQYQPSFKNRGFLVGIEHTYYQQTYTGGEQESHTGLLYIGYRL